jgi:hypothetical protein
MTGHGKGKRERGLKMKTLLSKLKKRNPSPAERSKVSPELAAEVIR